MLSSELTRHFIGQNESLTLRIRRYDSPYARGGDTDSNEIRDVDHTFLCSHTTPHKAKKQIALLVKSLIIKK